MARIPHVAKRQRIKLYVLFLGTLIISVILPIVAVLCILSAVSQKFVDALAKHIRSDLSHLLDEFDLHYFLHARPNVNIVKHFVCDGQVQLDYLREQFHRRIINCCDPDGNLKYRKLRQTWTQFGGYMFWKWDPNFDLNNHVRLYDYTEPELAIPIPCTEEDLKRVMGSLISKPYLTPCPWEMLLTPVYHYVDETDGQSRTGSVLTLKIHHGLADGFSIFKLLNQLFDIRLGKFPTPNFPQLSPLSRLVWMAAMVIKLPFDIAHTFVHRRDDPSSWHIVDQKLSKQYLTFYSDRIPVATIKAIKNKYGVGYNTAVYAITAGAVSRLMKEAGQEVPKSMTSSVPYPLPNHPGGLVNHHSITIFTISPSTKSPTVRLREIASQINDPVSLPTRPMAINWMIKILLKLPVPALRRLTSHGSEISIPMTSYPMHEVAGEIVEGVRIRDIIPALSLPHGTTGAIASCITAVGSLRIVLTVDKLIFRGYAVPRNFNELVNMEVDGLLLELLESIAHL